MDTKSLECFVRLYNDKSMSVAADNLYMTQQGLSRMIKRMEDELGTKLFTRSNRGVTPTKMGRLMFKKANIMLSEYRQVLNAANDSQTDVSGIVNSVLELGVLSLLTPNPFLKFISQYQSIETTFGEHREIYCHNMLLDETADVGLVVKDVDRSIFDVVPFCKVDSIVYLSKDHPLAKKSHITVDDLRYEKLLLCGSSNYYSVIRDCTDAGFEARIAMSSADINATMQCVQSGLGISPFIMGMNKAFPCPEDIVIRPFDRKDDVYISMITKKGRPISPAVKLFMDYFIGYFDSYSK